MKALIPSLPRSGHFHPLVPLAQALLQAGHEVVFVSDASFCPVIEACGFASFPVTHTQPFPLTRPQQGDARAVALLQQMERLHARVHIESMIPDLLVIGRTWDASLIIGESRSLGISVAAEILGIPHVTVEVGAFRFAPWGQPLSGYLLNLLRAGVGLPPDPQLATLYRYLHLSFVPPSYQLAEEPLPPTSHAFRPTTFDRSGTETLPLWIATLPRQPTIYVCLGTFFNRNMQVFTTILEGLRDQPYNLILTVGRDQDPKQLGSQPPNVYIERYIPQSLLMPYCDLVITHGGANTVMGAIVQQLPLIIIPQGADQPEHALRCAALQIGHVINAAEFTASGLAKTVSEVLSHPGYRQNLRRLHEEIGALPSIEDAVSLLERLARERRPLKNDSLSALSFDIDLKVLKADTKERFPR